MMEKERAIPKLLYGSAVVWALFMITLAAQARAADNTATGDIAGVAGTLAPSNTVTINTVQLALVKAAFLTDGTLLASGSDVAPGMRLNFMVAVDNVTTVAADSVNVQDALATSFAYQPGTLKVDSSQSSGATQAAIYAAVDATAPVTDAVSGADVAGVSVSTVSAGAATGNAVLVVPANRVWAMLFTVTVQ